MKLSKIDVEKIIKYIVENLRHYKDEEGAEAVTSDPYFKKTLLGTTPEKACEILFKRAFDLTPEDIIEIIGK